MKNQIFLITCAAGLLWLPVTAQEKEHTALGKQMEAMNDAYKAFRRETDPVKGAASAREAQKAALQSASEIPELVKEMPEGPDKEKAALSYRKMMGKLYVSLCEVEEAFVAGKLEEVAKLVDSLKEMKKTGHDQFMKEEE
jgi:soluble cytochrome b562